MKPVHVYPRQCHREQGSALITGIVLLMILTLLALSSLSSGMVEEKLAANERDRQVAFQAAEAMLREAESSLFDFAPFDPFDPNRFTDTCLPTEGEKTGGLCTAPLPGKPPRWQTLDWTSNRHARTFANPASHLHDQLGALPAQPRYIVEIVSAPYQAHAAVPCEPGVAHITARGEGRHHAIVLLQSSYRFLPKECL